MLASCRTRRSTSPTVRPGALPAGAGARRWQPQSQAITQGVSPARRRSRRADPAGFEEITVAGRPRAAPGAAAVRRGAPRRVVPPPTATTPSTYRVCRSRQGKFVLYTRDEPSSRCTRRGPDGQAHRLAQAPEQRPAVGHRSRPRATLEIFDTLDELASRIPASWPPSSPRPATCPRSRTSTSRRTAARLAPPRAEARPAMPADRLHDLSTRRIEVERPEEVLRRPARPRRRRPRRPDGHGARPARPERRRQDHDRAHPRRRCPPRRRHRPRRRPRRHHGAGRGPRRSSASPASSRPSTSLLTAQREPPAHGRPAPPRPRAGARGPTSCSSSSTSSTRPTSRWPPLRRHAPPARPGHDAGGRPAGDLPRRAHHRPGPAQPAGPVGPRARPRRRRHDRSSSPRSTSRRPTSSPTAIALLDGGRIVAHGHAGRAQAARARRPHPASLRRRPVARRRPRTPAGARSDAGDAHARAAQRRRRRRRCARCSPASTRSALDADDLRSTPPTSTTSSSPSPATPARQAVR